MADQETVPEEMSHADLVAEVKRLRRDLEWAQDQEEKLERYFDKVRDRATDAHDELRAIRGVLAQRDREIERLDADLNRAVRDLRVRDAQLEAQATTLRHYHIVIEHMGAEIERRDQAAPVTGSKANGPARCPECYGVAAGADWPVAHRLGCSELGDLGTETNADSGGEVR